MKERKEGEFIEEGWSYTKSARLHLFFRRGNIIAHVAIKLGDDVKDWSCDYDELKEEPKNA